MTDSRFDVIVIGGGHNGLVTAAYLAKSGRKVVVLERRDRLGGSASTEQVFDGFRFETGAHDASLFRNEIIRELGLDLNVVQPDMSVLSLLPDGRVLRLWRDPQKAAEAISEFSNNDARSYSKVAQRIQRFSALLEGMLGLTPPNLPFEGGLANLRKLIPWVRIAARLRRFGGREMYEFLRSVPMDVASMLGEWFEDDHLQGALATAAIQGSMQGPRASGTGLMLLYHAIGGFPRGAKFVRGGIGRLSDALAARAREFGAEIRTGQAVEKIITNDYAVSGVRLSDGEELRAGSVASSADPRHTLLELVGASQLEVRVVRRARNIRFRGSTAKVNLALRDLPAFEGVGDNAELAGHIIISPSLDYLERAYDDAKYGRLSSHPQLEMILPSLHDPSLAPDGQHVLSITARYAPYHLKQGAWDQERETLGDRVVNTVAQYAPNLPELILHQQVLTPVDYEREYGLTEGSVYHGQMALDQLLYMRPIPGFADYRSPVGGLYFCGAGAHPGGGVTGAPGRNAARMIREDLK
jgi:phytoene dehydrogenase-like protein